MSATPSEMPSQVDAGQFHPEFGYLAPTMRYRRKVALTLKGAVLGALGGAVAMFVVSMDREEEKALAMLATPVALPPVSSMPAVPTPVSSAATPAALKPTPIAATPASPTRTPTRRPRTAAMDLAAPPVRFVPETIALPAVAPRDLQLRGSMSPEIAATASERAPRAPSTVGASPAASELAVAPAPAAAAKAAAKPRKKRIVRRHPTEPEPRAAFAGPPSRPFGLPIFGFGW